MSIQNILIDGVGHFIETAENAGIVTQGVFEGSAINSGMVTTTATFSGTAINSGVVGSAVFSENASNTGNVTVAVFTGTAINTGTVSQAEFHDSASNNGTVSVSAFFADSASNAGTVQGDAIFADTTTNTGSVQGDAQVAATATNSGTVQGTTTVYEPSGSGGATWYSDESDAQHAVTLNGTVTQSDEGSGVVAAYSSNSGNIQTSLTSPFGADDFDISLFVRFVNANASADEHLIWQTGGGLCIFRAPNNDIGLNLVGIGDILRGGKIIDTNWHHILVNRVNGTLKINLDGADVASSSNSTNFSKADLFVMGYVGYNYTVNGRIAGLRIMQGSGHVTNESTMLTQLPENVSGTQLLLNFGATAVPTVINTNPANGTVLSTETNYITINGSQYANGTYDVIADGNGGSTNGNYQYAPSGTEFYNDGTNRYQSDGSGSYTTVAIHWYDDISSAAHTVTLNGTVTQSDEGSGVVAAAFNGLGGTLTGSIADMSGQAVTVEFFAKLNSIAEGTIINMGTGSSPVGLHVAFSANGHIVLSDGIYNVQTTNAEYSIGTWNHYAVVYNGSGTYTTYKNGTSVGTTSMTYQAGATKFSVGNYFGNATAPLNGKIVGLRVTNAAVYTSDFSVPTTLPTAVTGTQLLLNFGATAVPAIVPVTYTSWVGAYLDCAHSFTHSNLYTDSPTLAIGVNVYTFDGTNYNLEVSSDRVVVDDTVYHYIGGSIVDITSCSGY